jgi:hypothetical protein
MSYTLHIERTSPIPLEEWLRAASKITSLRAQAGRVGSSHDPALPSATMHGDLEIIDADGRWKPAFRFADGRGSFPVRDCDAPMRAAATRLASALGATIVGDERERYSW